jgi:hypothetical protein
MSHFVLISARLRWPGKIRRTWTHYPRPAGYCSGTVDEGAGESSKSDGSRCFAYFHAMWYAYLIKDTALVNKFYDPLSKVDQPTCAGFLAFAKKFRTEGTQVHSPVP